MPQLQSNDLAVLGLAALVLLCITTLAIAGLLLAMRAAHQERRPDAGPPSRPMPCPPRVPPRLPGGTSGSDTVDTVLTPDATLVLPSDGDLARAAASALRARKFQLTMKRATECVRGETALISAVQERRDAALAFETSERSARRRAENAERVEDMKHESALMDHEHARLLHDQRLHAVRRSMTKDDRTLNAEVTATIRQLDPTPPPPPLPDEVEKEIENVAGKFKLLAATVKEAIGLHEVISDERERVAARLGPAVAQQVIEQALDLAGILPSAQLASGGWFTKPDGGQEMP